MQNLRAVKVVWALKCANLYSRLSGFYFIPPPVKDYIKCLKGERQKKYVKPCVCDIYSGETREFFFLFHFFFIVLVVLKLAEYKKITKMKIRSENKAQRRRNGFLFDYDMCITFIMTCFMLLLFFIANICLPDHISWQVSTFYLSLNVRLLYFEYFIKDLSSFSLPTFISGLTWWTLNY